jgi:hypothetical protein
VIAKRVILHVRKVVPFGMLLLEAEMVRRRRTMCTMSSSQCGWPNGPILSHSSNCPRMSQDGIISYHFCVTLNHFWWFEIREHNFCFAIFLLCKCFGFLCFWAWILVLLQVSQSFSLDVLYHLRNFMLCVVSVVIVMVIGVNIGMHDTDNLLN